MNYFVYVYIHSSTVNKILIIMISWRDLKINTWLAAGSKFEMYHCRSPSYNKINNYTRA